MISKLRHPDQLRLPSDWEIIAAADTGTYMSGLIAAIPPDDDPDLYFLEEFPNYRYVGGEIELIGLSVTDWLHRFARRLQRYTGDSTNDAWTDRNTQFRTELQDGLTLRPNQIHLEVRTEVLREYVQRGKVKLTPWLAVFPYEMERAQWPSTDSSAKYYTRIKRNDHTLDCAEHIASRRPLNTRAADPPKPRLIDRLRSERGKAVVAAYGDPHLGSL